MIIEKFKEQVLKYPDKIAIKSGENHLTYRYLDRISRKLSDIFSKENITMAGLLFGHDEQMIGSILGALNAGTIYIPLDPDYPEKRLVYMLKDSCTSFIITHTDYVELAVRLTEMETEQAGEKPPIRVITIDSIPDDDGDDNDNDNDNNNAETQESGIANEERTPQLDSPAYILYTSGSTGKPKGVMQTVENILYFTRNWTERFSVSDRDRLTLFASYCHDGSVPDIFSALLNGATLFPLDVKRNEAIGTPARWVIKEAITIWHSVPTLYRYFTNTLTGTEPFTQLRLIVLGGEPVREHDLTLFKKHFPFSEFGNIYGQTESTVSSIWKISSGENAGKIIIGVPIDETDILLVDEEDNDVGDLEVGEIILVSRHLSPGYLNDPISTSRAFGEEPELGRIYRTGDLGRLLTDGNIEIMGRKDYQVKVRGFRVEPGEIETVLLHHPGIREAIVLARDAGEGGSGRPETEGKDLWAYFVPENNFSNVSELTMSSLREYLATQLPDYMIPGYFVVLDEMPLTPTGKVDRGALKFKGTKLGTGVQYTPPKTDLEKLLTSLWQDVLNVEKIGIYDNFFDLGGNSMDVVNLSRKLKEKLKIDIPVVAVYRYLTIHEFTSYLTRELGNQITEPSQGSSHKKIDGDISGDIDIGLINRSKKATNHEGVAIAVIGMSGRFPGAGTIEEYWENLKNGVESICFLSDDELNESGAPPDLISNPSYVKAVSVMDGIEYFDAHFFGYTPNEADIMDPQIRIFHECAWHALEDAGYDPYTYQKRIGCFVGAASNLDWQARVIMAGASLELGVFGRKQFFDKDYIGTRVAHRLNLRGPAISLQTACSTSLVTVHLACQSLLNGECSMALAGGVNIGNYKKTGYLYQDEMIYSSDGHCRAFDAKADGTIFGDGVGAVVLKPLEQAIADCDPIHAVIKGSFINNDGIVKGGYLAPSIEGQASVIQTALRVADVEPESIGYIETHGTGTTLGDPIEIEGLKLAFNTNKKKFCAIGSVKTNIGHLNIAAGIAGLIKTILTVKHGFIPPSLHYQTPNPNIDFENSPFYVNTRLREWRSDECPLRAGISSFGIGGTNVHMVLEEAPQRPPSSPGKPTQLLVLSAKTMSSLDRMTANLADFLKQHPEIHLADAAYTLQVGRKTLEHNRIIVCSNHSSAAIEQIEKNENLSTAFTKERNKDIVFMFSGQGSQYVNMGLELYQHEPVFREHMDRCFDILNKQSGYDIKAMLYPGESDSELSMDEAKTKIDDVRYSGPIKFSIESALAKWVMQQWGMKPYAMIGHSFGEYAAAYVSGVFSLEDALTLVVLRGQLMEKTLAGAMMSVPLSAEELKPLLTDEISLAAINTPSLCIVSGPTTAIETFEKELNEQGHECLRINFPRASHSNMMVPILDEFEAQARTITWNPPQIPYIAGLTGDWVTNEDAMNPRYWARHMAETIQFSPGIKKILEKPDAVFLQVGCDRGLPLFVTKHREGKDGNVKINLLRNPKETVSDSYYLLHSIGLLWLHGVTIDWSTYYANERRNRIPLPGYVFDRKYYWLEEADFSGANPKVGKKKIRLEERPANESGEMREHIPTGNLLAVNETERRVLAIWQDLLGYENIGLNDNFFDLGGDSLAAIEVKKRIRDAFDIQVPVVKILHYPTIRSFVENVLEANKDVEANEGTGNENQEETAETQKELIDILDKF
ncbi:MAG: amino acid adenylation domain-containing protein [Candidatus Omnitrophota bacterium]